jgi:Domain of unknown function (DUF4129)
MTSRQPGITAPGTTGHVGTADGVGTPGITPDEGDGRPDDGDGRPDDGDGTEPALTAQDWLLRLLPLTLLIIAGLAGLRGAVGALRWNGPAHQHALVVGVVLEVVIVTMLVILLIRRRSGSQEATAARLRGVLLSVLGAGGVAVAVLTLAGLHVHVFSQGARPRPRGLPAATPSGSIRPRLGTGAPPHISLTVLLYALLVVVLLAGIAVCIWLARRLRPPAALRDHGDDFIVEDPERLREAVESGRSALRTVDDARAAIIACYLAMEASLAERGAARGAAGTPGELLTRATDRGLVRGTAAGRLTALFYEARFSSHPLGHRQRDEAEQALDELAADLAEAGRAEGAGRVEGAGRGEGAGRAEGAAGPAGEPGEAR